MKRSVTVLLLFALACGGDREAERDSISEAEVRAIADTLTSAMASAYDFSRPNPREGLLALYPDSGRVISAAAGRITTTRVELDSAIGTFWEYVGQNMREPRWEWGDVHVDVLSRDAAVVTASYSIPHHTPAGRPHTIAGAWTAVFVRRDGEWKILHEHLSDLPPEPDTAHAEH